MSVYTTTVVGATARRLEIHSEHLVRIVGLFVDPDGLTGMSVQVGHSDSQNRLQSAQDPQNLKSPAEDVSTSAELN